MDSVWEHAHGDLEGGSGGTSGIPTFHDPSPPLACAFLARRASLCALSSEILLKVSSSRVCRAGRGERG